jgi:hypothetical protein
MKGIFLTMTGLVTGLNFYLAYIFAMNSTQGSIYIMPLTLLLVYVIEILFQLILGLVLIALDKVESPTDIILPNFGFILFKMKKIYYSELGYFWTLKLKERIHVYKITPFYIKNLFDTGFYGDIEYTRLNIKKELEEIYAEELKRKKITDTYKKWNGYIDLKSERDDKLNQLGLFHDEMN